MQTKNLSAREFQVNADIARGYSVKEIAARLFLSPYTVDTHIKNIKKKTGAKNIADLTRDFILALDEPKQFFKTIVSLFFLSVQITMMFDVSDDINMRKPTRTGSRVVRVKSGKPGTKDQFTYTI